MSTNHGNCRDCAAPILWAKTGHGKNMPLNVRPTRQGDVLIDSRGVARVLSRNAADAQRRLGQTLYRRHHQTCPNAATGRLDLGGL